MKLRTLNDADLAFCKVIAGIRRMANRFRNTAERLDFGAEQNNSYEENGVVAEYAFCKHFNIFFDGTFAGKDAGFDCRLNGNRIDIKCVDSPNLNLIVNISKDNEKVDIYILLLVNGADVEILGWITREALCKPENIKDLGRGDRYFMKRSELREWVQHER